MSTERQRGAPDVGLIGHWQAEINNWKKQMEQATERLERLLRNKPGTDAYDGSLGKVWAEAEVLATKAEHAKMVIDELTEETSN
jgi:hypothetical protein